MKYLVPMFVVFSLFTISRASDDQLPSLKCKISTKQPLLGYEAGSKLRGSHKIDAALVWEVEKRAATKEFQVTFPLSRGSDTSYLVTKQNVDLHDGYQLYLYLSVSKTYLNPNFALQLRRTQDNQTRVEAMGRKTWELNPRLDKPVFESKYFFGVSSPSFLTALDNNKESEDEQNLLDIYPRMLESGFDKTSIEYVTVFCTIE